MGFVLGLLALFVGFGWCLNVKLAFEKDGFVLDRCLEEGEGLACVANSTHAFNYRTLEAKRAYYVKGTPYQWGWFISQLAYEHVSMAATSFLDRIPLALIAPQWIERHDGWAVRQLEAVIADILTHWTLKAFDVAVADGSIPQSILQELNGLVDGAKLMAPNGTTAAVITLEKLIAINYGFDVITARLFSGHLSAEILQRATTTTPRLRALLEADLRFLREIAACDAIGVRGSWVNQANYSGFLMRDMQFEMAGVLQDAVGIGAFVPPEDAESSSSSSSSSSSAVAAVRVFAPGIVGVFAGISEHGLALGFNTIRSSNSNDTHVGLNSLLLARHVIHHQGSATLKGAVELVMSAQRGAPFMYPMCDASGDCAVLEAGRWLPSGVRENPLNFVSKDVLETALLPTQEFIEQNACSTQSNGVFVRFMNYSYPNVYLKFDPLLWQRFGTMPYHAKWFASPTPPFHFVYANFTENNLENQHIANRWFIGQLEEDPDLVILSNFGVVPENRLMMMSRIDDYLQGSAEAPMWRYNMMASLVYAARQEAPLTLDKMVWIADFLSPDRTPGYWKNYANATDPMSAIIEGVICVFDLQNRVAKSHFGYFADGWVQLSLLNYI